MSTSDVTLKLDPAILIIFGITGDLAKKYLLPALYQLAKNNSLPVHFEIIGITRRDVTEEDVLTGLIEGLEAQGEAPDQIVISKLKDRLQLFKMDLTTPVGYQELYQHLNVIEDKHAVHMNRLYYLSIPPQVFGPVVRLLGETGHNASCQHGAASTRLLVEKPFGYDLCSAEELIKEISIAYGDFQLYRIDHYLAKETVQNIMTFRFNNPLFEAVWDHESISHIMISATEKLDIQGRVAFYEQTGAVRDLIQSHLLQLLALTTMERPATLQSKDIHAAKLELMKAIKPIAPDQLASSVVLGQYEGYRDQVGDSKSTTETYAAMKLVIDNERWKNTPMFLSTGKAMHARATTITVVFRAMHSGEPSNRLTFHLQPDEGITLQLHAKQPGLTNEVHEVPMTFKYSTSFHGLRPDAYERVLIDAIRGDKTLFSTSEEVLASWRVIEPIVQHSIKNSYQPLMYRPGSEGPTTANKLLHPTDTYWP